MLNLNCAICAELFKASDDAHVTTCGHMFHIACLAQWLKRSKTCPQCRNKCTDRNIIRVYFNLANLDSSHIDVGSLQEQLDSVQLQLNLKEIELKNRDVLVQTSKETQRKCMKTIAGLEKDLQSKKFLLLNYAEKTKVLESQVKLMDDLRKECDNLKEQIQAMNGVNTLLALSMADAEKILNAERNPKILSTWVATLKRELKMCEAKKAEMRTVLKSVQNNMRKEIEQRKLQEERTSQLESENYQLLEKIKSLQATVKENNLNSLETVSDMTIGLNRAYNNIDINASAMQKFSNDKRLTISPSIKDNVKKIEDSSSPYLNIKSCSVLMAPVLLKNETRMRNHTKTLNNKITTLKVSPKKANLGAIRKARSDFNQKYSIFKKPREELVADSTSSGSTMRPLASNYVFNGFGGSERVDPFEERNHNDFVSRPSLIDVNTLSDDKSKHAPACSINNRLKTGGLRNIKLTK